MRLQKMYQEYQVKLLEDMFNSDHLEEGFVDKLNAQRKEVERRVERLCDIHERLLAVEDSLAATIAEIEKTEIVPLQERLEKLSKKRRFILDLLRGSLFNTNFTTDRYKIKHMKSYSVEVEDMAEVPTDYKVVTETVDKRKASAALKKDEGIPGLTLKSTLHTRIDINNEGAQ